MTTSHSKNSPSSVEEGSTLVPDTATEKSVGDGASHSGTEAARRDISASNRRGGLVLAITAILLVVFAIIAMGIGQLGISPVEVLTIIYKELGAKLGLATAHIEADQAEIVAITQIRAPRILLSILLGGALATSGAVLQALFRNPLVSPDIVGVSSGASFGGVLAILLGSSSLLLMGSSFLFGLTAVLIVMLIGRIRTNSPTLTIVLAGVVVAAFFSAMVSLITYVADPYEKLPSINFWLMGSFASATWSKLAVAVIPIVVGVIVVHALRWRINVLSLGDEDARALGLNPSTMRWILILTVALLTAASVSAAGEVGWVGLVIPHLVRILVGHDNRVVLPGSFLVGGLYLLLIDTIARTATTVEIPIGILTASIGAPVFIFLLIQRSRKGQSFA
ncbi:FecCD family ABC transporter permease [Corynebacterium cystitidis]|uniref:Iron complex transport system permease protein n=1 Tax=Corynebacterium cystitidis DSM 20524 TaxID=1121357 RepID=A0A1H9V345_9CORY|nr:iron ABC transporter permease [Corynebacterium cystitidis]WJY83374.1 putative ABC transporter permease protein [Corynebacterium cystitidis DSM 20524]SES16008.1 iron complex transport system permease protein [Corynebacterium cystitidis DSM 20524]SNV62514.1 ABC transporter transmembrane protein [Corynebacterium cystitidis]